MMVLSWVIHSWFLASPLESREESKISCDTNPVDEGAALMT